jgi:iron complex transport system substrate-binding protein
MSAAKQQPAEPFRPRVVSLLPSATEMLSLIGAEIVGRSHECDFPEDVRDGVPALTGAHNKFEDSAQMHDAVTESLRSGQGLYWLDSQRLAELRPDAIVTQSLCSVCAVDLDIVRKAAAKTFPAPRIIDTNPMSLQDVISDIRRLGGELGMSERGDAAAAALQARVDCAVKQAEELAAAAAVAAAAGTSASGAAEVPAQHKRVREPQGEWQGGMMLEVLAVPHETRACHPGRPRS